MSDVDTFYMIAGDKTPHLRARVKSRRTGEYYNLTNAAVTFSLIDSTGDAVIDKAAGVVEDPGTDGIMHFAWVGDEEAGTYYAQFRVVKGSDDFRVPKRTDGLRVVIGEAST